MEGLGNILGGMGGASCAALASDNAAAHQVDESWHAYSAQIFGSVDRG
jgi:hypothetical protein